MRRGVGGFGHHLKKHPVRHGVRDQLRRYGAVDTAGERLLAARRRDNDVMMLGGTISGGLLCVPPRRRLVRIGGVPR
jgi:hypothetical protein